MIIKAIFKKKLEALNFHAVNLIYQPFKKIKEAKVEEESEKMVQKVVEAKK